MDSGASVHMLSRKDLDAAELETVRVSRDPTKVMTANEEVQSNEEPTGYVRDLNLFVTTQFLEDTPPVPSLGKLGYFYEWTGGQNPQLMKDGRNFRAMRRITSPQLFQVSQG